MADDEIVFVLTDTEGFSKELPTRFKPETYTPSSGGQNALYRAYGSDTVIQTSDSKGIPGAIRLKMLLDRKDEIDLMEELEIYTKLCQKAINLTRTGAKWGSWTLIRGASYAEAEVLEKSKRVNLILTLIPDKLSNLTTLLGEPDAT